MMDRLRLLPIVILCASMLLGLKLADLATGGAGTQSFAGIAVARAEGAKTEAVAAETAAPDEGGQTAAADEVLRPEDFAAQGDPRLSKAEMSVLESLAARRAELNKRAETLDMREQVLAAAEKRVEDRIAELREIDRKINSRIAEIDAAQEAQMASLVAMYEGMKPKDAARIFERLDMGVLLDVVKRMQPRKMSAVLAAMDPVVAQDLTVELATGERLVDIPVPEAALPADKNAS
ncbi:MAG: FlaA [Parvibaculum sp.]|nr:FlaA [Parvibaculum sp.]